MQSFTPEQILEQAKWLEESSRLLAEAARRMRDSAEILAAVNQRHPGGIRSVLEGPERSDRSGLLMFHHPTTTTQSPEQRSRMKQIEQLLRMCGPMTRNQLLDLADSNGIPRNTVGAYLTKDNFSQSESGYWWLKNEQWPRGMNG
jgi:hypothetical protein